MSIIPPLYVCPDCEPGPYMYAGKIVAKVCSRCESLCRNAQTGFDRAKTGADRKRCIDDYSSDDIRRMFNAAGIKPVA